MGSGPRERGLWNHLHPGRVEVSLSPPSLRQRMPHSKLRDTHSTCSHFLSDHSELTVTTQEITDACICCSDSIFIFGRSLHNSFKYLKCYVMCYSGSRRGVKKRAHAQLYPTKRALHVPPRESLPVVLESGLLCIHIRT